MNHDFRHQAAGARIPVITLFLLATLSMPSFLAAQEHQEHTRAGHTSPYAERAEGGIAALTPEEIEGLLTGQGMGMALPAELNGYPGPRHVLEMAEELGITTEQRAAVETVYSQMHATAVAHGERIVTLEGELDEGFSTGEITESDLEELVSAIAEERANLRASHLRAHLRLVPILTPDQIRKYSRLRGYGS